jgi:hypothetical protein
MEEKVVFKFDTNTVLAYLYLMYKTNMISRNNLRAMLAEVKKQWPDDVAKYLVEESIQ